MKPKRFTWIFSVLIVTSLVVLGNQPAWGAPIKVKVATAMPESHPNAISLRYLGERAKEVSGGLLEVEVFTSGSVGGEGEIVESVSLGTIQIYMGATAPLVSYVHEFSIFDLPYLFKDRNHVDNVMWGPLGTEIGGLAIKREFRILGWADSGFQGFYNSRRPITSLADMKGLKMRVMKNPIRIKAMNAYGASAVPLAWTETYSAMETRVVDGCENSYETYRAGAHYEVAKYYTESNHEFMTAAILVSEKFYQSLSPRLKAIITQLCGLTALRYRQVFEEKNAKARKLVQEKGAVINVLPDSVRKEFRKAAQPVYDEYVRKFGSDLIEKIQGAQ